MAKRDKSQIVMELKKEGKHVAHFFDGATKENGQPNLAAKDLYMPHDDFEAHGKPNLITVTIESGDKTKKKGK